MKIAIMTDSNSGITAQEAQQLGVALLPMPIQIDGQMYLEESTCSLPSSTPAWPRGPMCPPPSPPLPTPWNCGTSC